MSNNAPPIDWILTTGPPWARVIATRDLLGQTDTAAYDAMLRHPHIGALLDAVSAWPGEGLKRHNNAGHPLHKLAALAEFGLTHEHPRLAPVVDFILTHPAEDGALQTMLTVHKHFGGDGTPHLSWMLCDAPTLLYAMLRLGVSPDEPAITRAAAHIAGQVRANGWPCASASEFGKFRGPGRKADPCPYANLTALKALALMPTMRESAAVRAGIESLLWHWDIQKERKPYMFGIGTDFRKPKYPLVWYDILHVTDVLSRFPRARQDARLHAMATELHDQADAQGRFTARSMYRAWKGWDFADKKTPSPTISATAWRTLIRLRAKE